MRGEVGRRVRRTSLPEYVGPSRRTVGPTAPNSRTFTDRLLREPVLERALDRRVERVQPVERQRFGGCEAPAGERVSSVVSEHAMEQREYLFLRHPRQHRL